MLRKEVTRYHFEPKPWQQIGHNLDTAASGKFGHNGASCKNRFAAIGPLKTDSAQNPLHLTRPPLRSQQSVQAPSGAPVACRRGERLQLPAGWGVHCVREAALLCYPADTGPGDDVMRFVFERGTRAD
eukprot:7383831-Prymnesium_polylepis.1